MAVNAVAPAALRGAGLSLTTREVQASTKASYSRGEAGWAGCPTQGPDGRNRRTYERRQLVYAHRPTQIWYNPRPIAGADQELKDR